MTIRDLVVKFGFDVDKNSKKETEDSIRGIKNLAKDLLGKVAVVFSVAKLSSFAKDCVQAASDVEEMQNKFDVVFDGITDDVEKWADEFSKSVGRNKNTIKGYLADQQNLLVGFGMTREAGAKLSEEMTSLALDLASFANTDETVAVNAMTKAVMGESEAAKTLGAVLNDSTREAAMMKMGLSGTYNSLDQLTKMQVNYNAILMQSPDAVGDCVRSIDSYEARTRQLNSSIAEFKEFIGGKLLPVFAVFISWLNIGVQYFTKFAKAILGATDEDNRLLKMFQRIQALLKIMQPAFERFAQGAQRGIKSLADRLGGMENLMKLVAVVAGAFILAMNWSKIIGMASGFMKMLSGIGKLFSAGNLKIMAIVAVIVVLALIVEDFINFLQGNDSVIGTLFDRIGIGADNARNAIFEVFGKIKNFLEEHSEEIRGMFEAVWGAITQIIQAAAKIIGAVFLAIMTVAVSIFGALVQFWEQWGDTISEFFSLTFGTIISVVTQFADMISALFSGDIKGAFEAFIGIVDTLHNFIQQAFQLILSIILTIIGNIVDGVKQKGAEIRDKLMEAINSGIEYIKSLPAEALQWGADIIDGIAKGITGSIGKITGAVSGIGDRIKSFLHFSVPDEGPLRDYESWMPDFMSGLAGGIEDNQDTVLNKVRGLAGGIRAIMASATAKVSTTRAGTMNSRSSSVTQNVNIENSYSGGSSETQRNVSKAMKKSAVDATTQMARGLAYARG